MKKTNTLAVILFLALNYSCSQESNSIKYSNTITEENLKDLLYVYASDEFEGRETGEKGQKLAVEFLREFYKENKIPPAENTEDYFQKLRLNLPGKVDWVESENVAAIIKGSDKPNEFIVISAHLDHVGKRGEDIYNGADDDGSGSMALLEIAQAFKIAVKDGFRPKRSIVFFTCYWRRKRIIGITVLCRKPSLPIRTNNC